MDVASVMDLPIVHIERNHLDEKAAKQGDASVQNKTEMPKQNVKK